MNETCIKIVDDEEAADIPQWQIDEGRKIKEYYDKNPNELLSWDQVRKQLNLYR